MREIVERLALALDKDDYETARETLSADVRYDVKGVTLVGADAVLESYRKASESAHLLFDAVGYDHRVASEEGSEFVVEYTDVLTIEDETIVHHARQRLVVDPELGVVRIINDEVEGESEKVDRFLARHGRAR